MLKTIIIDDEPKARSALKQELALNCPEVELIGEADSVHTGIELIRSVSPDLVFLDIQLSDGLGFHILEKIHVDDFAIIFTTAYSEYALKAFKTNAVDYLLKPIDSNELMAGVARVIKQNRHDNSMQIELLLRQLSQKTTEPARIVLKDINKTYFVKTAEILYCEAEGIYTKFLLADQTTILVSKNLKEYESVLEPLGFLRTHHSFLVNPIHIKLFDKADGGTLVLDNGKHIPVSQRKKDFVLKILEQR